ncbi:MAG: FecR domain-containing protein [Rhodospirillales bacterium]|nr:FecR domain-containing protein [Rhodospirillales bacterium]
MSRTSAQEQTALHAYDNDMIALSDQAIDWLVRLQCEDATDKDRVAFDQWCDQSADHARAARDAKALFGGIDETETAQNWIGVAALSARNVQPSKPRPRRMGIGARSILRVGSIGRRGVVVMASVCALLAVVIVGGFQKTGLWARWNADYSTAIGELATVTLSDGTVAHLNTASAFSVDFSGDVRRIQLASGEVIFNVAKDAQHPFIVSASGGEAMALGTIYGVRIENDQVNVTVQEGIVEVRNGLGNSVRLIAGEQASYTEGSGPEFHADADLAAYGSWQRGKLIFNSRPLGDVIGEVQRYKAERIVIARDALRDLNVTGVFETRELDDLLNSLEQTTGAMVVKLPLLTVIY